MMISFTYHNPTKIEFGTDKERDIATHIKNSGISRVLLCYGSDRIVQNGLYDTITSALTQHNIEYIECKGIVSNPILSKVYEGINLAKKNNVDGILSIGGGSVLDSAKSIAVGSVYDGDIWDFYNKTNTITKALPIFAVMTLFATGSEYNPLAVLTNDTTNQKYSISSPHIYPKVSVLNPALASSVPNNYLAYSAVDIIAHVIEGYFTASIQPDMHSRMVENIVLTVIESTNKLLHTKDYDTLAQFAWASSLALNGSTTVGTATVSFPNHIIEHAISAICNIPHGAGLAIVIPAWAKWYYMHNKKQFDRFAYKIFGLSDAVSGIMALEEWFCTIGAPTRLSDVGITSDDILSTIIDNATQNAKHSKINAIYTKDVITTILHLAK